MRSFPIFLLLSLSAFTLACGGGDGTKQPGADSSTPPTSDEPTETKKDDAKTSSSGTVDGHVFTATHAIAYPKEVAAAAGYEIMISDHPLDCASATFEGASMIDIDVPSASGTHTVIAVWDAAPTAGEASSDFNAFDATCKTTTSVGSKSGSATVSAIGASMIEGIFDITFESSERKTVGSAKGAFHATICPDGFPKQRSCTPK